MRRHLALILTLFAFFTAAPGLIGQQGRGRAARPTTPPKPGPDPTVTILGDYKKLDVDGDGVLEIEDLAIFDRTLVSLKSNVDFVLVLVESRLVPANSGSPGDRATGRGPGYSSQVFLDCLDQFQKDLRADGFPNHLVRAQVYSGSGHHDGLTVIALRRLLRACRDKFPNFKGVIFVGSFPEPMLVRKWVWKKPAEGLTIGGKVCPAGTEYLRITPEIISERSDLVLADLTGNWEALYRPGVNDITSIEAVPDQKLAANGPRAGKRITSSQFNQAFIKFNDMFFIDDTDMTLNSQSGNLDFTINALLKHPEMTEQNKLAPNPIARPEIFVSRINARNIAINPNPSFIDSDGLGFLDANGKPRTFLSPYSLGSGAMIWYRDATLELRLLIDYFDRNHRYRTDRPGGPTIHAAAISYGDNLAGAVYDAQWMKDQCPDMKVRTKENASLVDYIEWLKGAGAVMFISAHSNGTGSEFGNDYGGAAALERALGPGLWKWETAGAGPQNGKYIVTYKPGFSQQGGMADFYVGRSIYENGLLVSRRPRIYIHKGCQVNSPENADASPYSSQAYGSFQNAECILFYLNGVAVVSRAKVFYDGPRDFIKGLTSQRGNVGKGWEAYYRAECNDAELAKDPADCKRSYTWSILGDWTLGAR